ncbi:hypothetical protein NQ318_002263, partial [Aromia moschata]
MDMEESKVELEDQMRLGNFEIFFTVNQKKIKKTLKLDINIDENEGRVWLNKTKLNGRLKKLPTIIESYKTNICNDKSTMFKTADICQMLECYKEEKTNKKDIHGYCPPLKNIQHKRFRKTMYNTDFAIEAESVTKELYYLLNTDLEA